MGDSLRRIREQPRAVRIVKLCDRITNLDPPPATWNAEKARAYAVEARTIVEQLGAADARLKQRFERKLREYELLLGSLATSTEGANG